MALLTSSPAEHTIPLTVLETVRAGRRFSDEPMLFGWFEDGGEVSGAVFRTPPFELLLAAVPEEATAELVAALLAAGADIPGVNGDVRDVDRFASAWTAATGQLGTTTLALDLYELGTLHHPEPPPAGRARPAEDADLDVAVRFYTAFQEETPTPSTEVLPLVRERLDDRRLWLWEDEAGAPVSLAARTPAVAGVARIAPVYTPPEHRRRGYAQRGHGRLHRRRARPRRRARRPLHRPRRPRRPTRCTSGSGSGRSAGAASCQFADALVEPLAGSRRRPRPRPRARAPGGRARRRR